MNPYKFPWIMERIESEAVKLQAKKLRELRYGMAYGSRELIKRGVQADPRRDSCIAKSSTTASATARMAPNRSVDSSFEGPECPCPDGILMGVPHHKSQP